MSEPIDRNTAVDGTVQFAWGGLSTCHSPGPDLRRIPLRPRNQPGAHPRRRSRRRRSGCSAPGIAAPFSSVSASTPESLASASVTCCSTSVGVCALLKVSSRGLSVTPILTSTLDPSFFLASFVDFPEQASGRWGPAAASGPARRYAVRETQIPNRVRTVTDTHRAQPHLSLLPR